MIEVVTASLTKHQVETLKAKDPDKYASLPDEGLSVNIQYDFGADLAEQAVIFGEKVCSNMIKGHVKFNMQARMRNMLAEGKTAKEIQKAFYNLTENTHVYKPTEGMTRMSFVEKQKARMEKLSPEEREKQKAELKALLESV
jgi:hypothetical protein